MSTPRRKVSQAKVALGTGDDVSGAVIAIGDETVLDSSLALSLRASAKSGLTQIGGAGSLALGAGASTGTVLATVGTDAIVTVGDSTALLGADLVSVSAGTDGLVAPDADQLALGEGAAIIDAEAYTGGAAGIGAGSAGVVIADMTGDATLDFGQGVVIGERALRDDSLGATNPLIDMNATRGGAVRSYVFNLALSAGLSAGLAKAEADIVGSSAIRFSDADTSLILTGRDLNLTADDTTRADAQAVSSSGGIVAGNGVDVRAANTGNDLIELERTAIFVDDLTVSNTSRASSHAKAKGISGGLATVGASVARSTTKVDIATTLGGGIFAQGLVDIASRFLPSAVKKAATGAAVVENALAEATSSAGGLLAGNGADAKTVLDYDVATTVGGIAGLLIKVTGESTARALVDATGTQGALAAIGVVLSNLSAPRANVSVTARDAAVISTPGDLNLRAMNKPVLDLQATSGSGGLVSGAGAGGTLDVDAATLASVGRGLLFADALRVQAENDLDLGSTVDSVNASLAGASGANMDTDIVSRVDTKLAPGASLIGADILIGAINGISRPEDGFYVTSGSGGALDVAAMDSDVTLAIDTLVDIGDDPRVAQTEDASGDDVLIIVSLSDVTLVDRQSLDPGGAIALSLGNSAIDVTSTDAGIKLGPGNHHVRDRHGAARGRQRRYPLGGLFQHLRAGGRGAGQGVGQVPDRSGHRHRARSADPQRRQPANAGRFRR